VNAATVEVRERSALVAYAVEVIAVAGRWLRHLLRAPARVMGVTLGPLVSLVMLGYLFRDSIHLPVGGGYADYLFPGAAMQVGLAGVGPTAVAVAVDLRSGLIARLRSLPIARSAVLLGHTLADLLVGLLSLAVVSCVGLLVGWRPHAGAGGVLAGFAVLAVFTFVMLWVGVLLAMLLGSVESISAVAPFVVLVLPFLSNAFLAPATMPAAIRPIAQWNPVSAVTTVCRRLWGNDGIPDGSPTTHAGLVIVVSLTLVFAGCLAISLRRFRTAGA
jgi:ABC-2 type transport system permease protein